MTGIFFSYSHKDKSFVQRLSADLRELGADIWIDEAELKVGDSLIERIRQGIDRMQYVAAVISSNSIQSRWVQKELEIAMKMELDGRSIKVLPLLLNNVDLPGFLEDELFADFREKDLYETGLCKLAERLGFDIDKPPIPDRDLDTDMKKLAGLYNRLGMLILTSDKEPACEIELQNLEVELVNLLGRKFNDDLNASYAFQTGDAELWKFYEKQLGALETEINRVKLTLSSVKSYRYATLREAVGFFRKSASLGDPEGMWNLGWRYWLGEGSEKNTKKAISWWKRAAERGHKEAAKAVGRLG